MFSVLYVLAISKLPVSLVSTLRTYNMLDPQALMKWVNYEQEKREPYLSRLMQKIRLPLIPLQVSLHVINSSNF